MLTSEQIDDGAVIHCRDVTQAWVTIDGVVLPASRSLVATAPAFDRVDIVLRDHRITWPAR